MIWATLYKMTPYMEQVCQDEVVCFKRSLTFIWRSLCVISPRAFEGDSH